MRLCISIILAGVIGSLVTLALYASLVSLGVVDLNSRIDARLATVP